MVDSSWVQVQIGGKIAGHKHPLNLASDEVLQFQDLNTAKAPGSLSLRKISENASPLDLPEGEVQRVGQQIRPDGVKVLAAVSKLSSDQRRLFVVNPDNGSWVSSFGAFPLMNLGDGESDLAISPDAIRACGEEGLAVVVKLGTMPYTEGGVDVMPRQFRVADGPQAQNWVGLGYVSWNGKVESFNLRGSRNFAPVSATRIAPEGNNANRRRGRRTGPRPSDPGDPATQSYSTWFGANQWVRYYYSVTYEGGQESPPTFGDEILNLGPEDENWVELTISADINFVPFAAKLVNIYRSSGSSSEDRPEHPTNAVLIASISIYKESDDFEDWEPNSEGLRDVFEYKTVDENEASIIGGTYFDRQQLSHEVTELSPNRRHHRIFSDRLFAWGVVADDGKIYGNRLYYSHVNGLGISCYDIIPPANYVEFPFNIQGLVSVRSHRIVIGDSKYAIGYFSGGAIQNWRIYESETEMGCRAPESVADTPFGAAYVGYDGIYVVNGLEFTGPLARGIIYPTESEFDWANAKAEFAQDDQEYVVVVPALPGSRNVPLIVAVNLRTGEIRRIEGIQLVPTAVGKDSQGKILLAGQQGIFRLEAAYGPGIAIDTPSPIVETGLRRFVQGLGFQKVRNLAIHGSWGPGSLKVTLTSARGVESTQTLDAQADGPVVVGFDALTSPDLSHKLKLEYVAKEGEPIETFQIDGNWADVLPGDRSFQ